MSWSVSASKIGANDKEFDYLEQRAIEAAKAHNPEGEDQAQLAVRIALHVIRSGVLGHTEKLFTVVLSGHGNPDHEPKAGWVNDMLSISIHQTDG